MSEWAGSARSLAAEKPSSVSLALAVTQTTLPSADVMTRTGWQPALTMTTTERPGSVSARRMLMTCSVPWPPRPPRPDGRAPSASSLVAYSHRPSGDTARPTGAWPAGMSPMRSDGPKPWASARCRLKTAISWLSSRLTNAYWSPADSATSMAPPPVSVSEPSTGCGLPFSAAATSMTSAPLPSATSR